jgi:mRNA-degrading endonuclease RelE of RelBE toxin-antitoxin system
MHEHYSTPSMRQTKFDTVAPDGQDPWDVELHREVGKDVAGYGLCDPSFSPTLGELISALEANPKQFPKKKGKLNGARAADLGFKGVTFRAVFVLEERSRTVFILSLDKHDVAYRNAVTRGAGRSRRR